MDDFINGESIIISDSDDNVIYSMSNSTVINVASFYPDTLNAGDSHNRYNRYYTTLLFTTKIINPSFLLIFTAEISEVIYTSYSSINRPQRIGLMIHVILTV